MADEGGRGPRWVKMELENGILNWPGDPESLTADAVDFEALAHVLANTCRRGGRLRRFHSLAAHAVLVSEAIENLSEPEAGDGRTVALHALLADAGVAWLGTARRPRLSTRRRALETAPRRRWTGPCAKRPGSGESPPPNSRNCFVSWSAWRRAPRTGTFRERADGAAPAVSFPPLPGRIRTVEPGRAARLWLDRLSELREPRGAAESGAAPFREDPGHGS